MSKLRVHDMAGEFGVTSDEVISLLRQMDVPVRSHLSLLTDDQVARLRARWEREKGGLTRVGELLQGGHRHIVAIHLEESPQGAPRVAAPEPVRAEHAI